MSAIVISDLTKRMGKKRLFSNLNLEVLEGEAFALLALDNCGKTTLSRILFNYLKPAKGRITIFDLDCVKDSKTIKESVGFVPEKLALQENLKASTLFKYTLSAHNFKNTEQLNYLIEYFDFNQRLRIVDMTDREKKLFSIINALIVKPRLIILDEPIKDLEEEDKVKLFTLLNKLKQDENLTIFMLTNSLVDAQKYCDRAAFLNEGEIIGVEFLKDKISNDKLVKIYTPVHNITPLQNIGAVLIYDKIDSKHFYFDKDMRDLSDVIANMRIDNYTIEDASLDDKLSALENKVKFDNTNNNINENRVAENTISNTEVIEPINSETVDDTVVIKEEV